MSVRDAIRRKLEQGLTPSALEIVDESASHAGHAGARPGGGTHFAVLVVSEKFAGKSRLERHKLVHQLLAEELSSRIHALRFTGLFTPGEYQDNATEC